MLGTIFAVCLAQDNGTIILGRQQAQWCDSDPGMCFAINIPSDTATDYYVSMTAPSKVGYILSKFSVTLDGPRLVLEVE